MIQDFVSIQKIVQKVHFRVKYIPKDKWKYSFFSRRGKKRSRRNA